jgi:hypothetical protein
MCSTSLVLVSVLKTPNKNQPNLDSSSPPSSTKPTCSKAANLENFSSTSKRNSSTITRISKGWNYMTMKLASTNCLCMRRIETSWSSFRIKNQCGTKRLEDICWISGEG